MLLGLCVWLFASVWFVCLFACLLVCLFACLLVCLFVCDCLFWYHSTNVSASLMLHSFPCRSTFLRPSTKVLYTTRFSCVLETSVALWLSVNHISLSSAYSSTFSKLYVVFMQFGFVLEKVKHAFNECSSLSKAFFN